MHPYVLVKSGLQYESKTTLKSFQKTPEQDMYFSIMTCFYSQITSQKASGKFANISIKFFQKIATNNLLGFI